MRYSRPYAFTHSASTYSQEAGWHSLQGTGKKYTISGKNQPGKENIGPGPAHYEPSNKLTLKRSGHITISPKFQQPSPADTPGPQQVKYWPIQYLYDKITAKQP